MATIHVLHGPDSFLVRGELRRLRHELDGGGLNTTVLDARAVRPDEIAAALGTPGFFGAGRVVIIADLLAQGTRSAGRDDEPDEPKKTKPTIDWAALFAGIEPSNIAVFVDAGSSSVPAAVKKALPAGVRVFTGEAPRGADLLRWIKARAEDAGSTIADGDARYLAETLCPKTWGAKPSNPAYDRPPDLELFAAEIQKLALAASGTITRATIDEMTPAAQPDRLFPLIDSFVAGDGAGVLRELRHAIDGGEELSRISAQLFQQIELMAALQASGPREDPNELGRALGLSNPNRMYAVQKSLTRLRAHPNQLIAAATSSERAFKSGAIRQPADQVYHLLEGALDATRSTREGGT